MGRGRYAEGAWHTWDGSHQSILVDQPLAGTLRCWDDDT